MAFSPLQSLLKYILMMPLSSATSLTKKNICALFSPVGLLLPFAFLLQVQAFAKLNLFPSTCFAGRHSSKQSGDWPNLGSCQHEPAGQPGPLI